MSSDRSYDAVIHDSSASDAPPVVPSDTATFPPTRGLYIGVAGDLTVRMVSGNTTTFVALANGWQPIRCDMVKSTGTSALSILALY